MVCVYFGRGVWPRRSLAFPNDILRSTPYSSFIVVLVLCIHVETLRSLPTTFTETYLVRSMY